MPPDTPHDDHTADEPASGARPAPRPLRIVAGGGSAEPDWVVVARVLAGEGTDADRAAVARWAATAPRHRAELDALGRWWDATAHLPSASRVDAMWRTVSARMQDGYEEAGGDLTRDSPPALRLVPPTRGVRDRAPRPRGRALALAAASLLAVVSGLAWWRLAPARRPTHTLAAAAAPREFTTRRGQQAAVTLADGSRVTLGPESRIRVHASAASRLLELTGEAVFTVQHDPARPFVVRAAHAVTEDLGTTFGVRAYPGDTRVRVVVTEGAVTLRAAGDPPGTGARLGPGKVGRLDRTGHVLVSPGDPDADLAWARGRVSFHNAPLGDVVTELSRQYDVTVRFARPADARRRITVEMSAGPLREVLDAVTVPLALTHRREGDTVVVRPAAP